MTTHDLTGHRVMLVELTPHPDNPRNGDTEAIAESLRVNGQYRPIVVGRGGVILAGNHTYAAALSLGWTTLAAVELNVDPYGDEARRIMLADNRTSDLGTYDEAALNALLMGFQDDLDGTGYTDDDLEELLEAAARSTTPAEDPAADATEAPEDQPDNVKYVLNLTQAERAEFAQAVARWEERYTVEGNAGALITHLRALSAPTT